MQEVSYKNVASSSIKVSQFQAIASYLKVTCMLSNLGARWHLPEKKRQAYIGYAKSPTAWDMFRPMPHLISCTGMTGRLRLHASALFRKKLSDQSPTCLTTCYMAMQLTNMVFKLFRNAVTMDTYWCTVYLAPIASVVPTQHSKFCLSCIVSNGGSLLNQSTF